MVKQSVSKKIKRMRESKTKIEAGSEFGVEHHQEGSRESFRQANSYLIEQGLMDSDQQPDDDRSPLHTDKTHRRLAAIESHPFENMQTPDNQDLKIDCTPKPQNKLITELYPNEQMYST